MSGARRLTRLAFLAGLALGDASRAAVLPETPPGAEPWPAELAQRVARAWQALPASESAPAAEAPGHRRRFCNRLLLESSSYLRQHAFDPIDWRPWGDAAFADARRLGRPVVLSIGYASCHWCHVMQTESFTDPELARILNSSYVAIKVDREERPEVDAIFQAASEAAGEGGGWPLTVWLTPEGEPFYTAGYLPRRDGERGIALGFATLLERLAATWREDPGRLQRRAGDLAAAIRRDLAPSPAAELPRAGVLDRAAAEAVAAADPVEGGFLGAPKFPLALPARALLRQHRRTGDPRAQAVAERTLVRLAASAVRDQIGGGFHRYATDARWQRPHFEKLLADNARLAIVYLEASAATERADFAEVARDTLRFVERELGTVDGGFANALDADSAAEDGTHREGWFYGWSAAALDAALVPAERRAWHAGYALSPIGDDSARGVPVASQSAAEAAAALQTDPTALADELARARETLRRARDLRPRPSRDAAVVVAANGLAISAFARAALFFDDPALAQTAGRAADLVLRQAHVAGRLRRLAIASDGGADAVLDDYAFLIAGLLDLHEATGEVRWLATARSLTGEMIDGFFDSKSGRFLLTRSDAPAPFARPAPATDDVQPSGNAVAALDLLRLAAWTGDAGLRSRAEGILRGFAGPLAEQPTSCGELLVALDFLLDSPPEIVVVTPGDRAAAAPFLAELRRRWLPNRVLTVLPASEITAAAASVPLVAGRRLLDGRPTAYVCRNFACQRPTTDPAELGRQLDRLSAQQNAGAPAQNPP